MALFVCDKCHAIDNSACDGNYWERLLKQNRNNPEFKVLCSECHTGKWHRKFPKKTYVSGDENRPGGIDYIPKALLEANRAVERIRKQFKEKVRSL